jgi:hypothetical protein
MTLAEGVLTDEELTVITPIGTLYAQEYPNGRFARSLLLARLEQAKCL